MAKYSKDVKLGVVWIAPHRAPTFYKLTLGNFSNAAFKSSSVGT